MTFVFFQTGGGKERKTRSCLGTKLESETHTCGMPASEACCYYLELFQFCWNWLPERFCQLIIISKRRALDGEWRGDALSVRPWESPAIATTLPRKVIARVMWERHLLVLAIAHGPPMLTPGKKSMLAQQGISAQLFSCSCMWQGTGTLRVSSSAHVWAVSVRLCCFVDPSTELSFLCLLKPRECAGQLSRRTSMCPMGFFFSPVIKVECSFSDSG